MDEVTRVLGNPVDEGNDSSKEKCSSKELSVCTEALKKLLELVQGLSDGDLARAVVLAAGHIGPHYWTNAANRKLARGWSLLTDGSIYW